MAFLSVILFITALGYIIVSSDLKVSECGMFKIFEQFLLVSNTLRTEDQQKLQGYKILTHFFNIQVRKC